MPKNLEKIAKSKKIKYFLISFVDLFGVLRSKLVPTEAISDMQKNGAGFAGFATWLDMTPADTDMFAIPDPDSLIQLPWNKEVGWLASDLWMDGKPVQASPRVMLKNQIEKLDKKKGETEVRVIVDIDNETLTFKVKNRRKINNKLLNSLNLVENAIID